jgi:hypothetical protein
MVGPDHPMFTDPRPYQPDFGNGDEGFFPGYGNLPGLPQPRFDPFGAVTGPHGPDVGNVGLPGPGGQFPRGRPAARHPGEPDPDHLPPPGMNLGQSRNSNNRGGSGPGGF